MKFLDKYKYTIILILLFGVSFFMRYFFCSRISGGAIWGDEYTYFNLGRDLFEKGEFRSQQYSILYPLLISIAFMASNVAITFRIIKIINVIAFCSIIIPAYMLGKKVCKDPKISLLYAFLVSIMPFGAASFVIWAEPLFYPISVWGMLFFVEFIEKANWKNMAKLIMGCTLIYMSKQSGMVFVIAVECGILYHYFFQEKEKKEKRKIYIFSLCGNILPIILWMLRNKLVGTSAMGYSDEISSYPVIFNEPKLFIQSVIYQLIDVILGSYFVFGILFIAIIFSIRKLSSSEKTIYIMIGLWTVGICVLSALHLTLNNVKAGGTITEETYGRYTCVVLPEIILIGLYVLIKGDYKRKTIFGVASVISVFTVWFSPIGAEITSKGAINRFNLTYLSSIINRNGGICWDNVINVDFKYKLGLTVFFVFLLVISVCRRKKVQLCAGCLIVALISFSGYYESLMLFRIMSAQNCINDFYIEMIKEGINKENTACDKEVNELYESYNHMWFNCGEFSEKTNGRTYLVTVKDMDYDLIFTNNSNLKLYKIK